MANLTKLHLTGNQNHQKIWWRPNFFDCPIALKKKFISRCPVKQITILDPKWTTFYGFSIQKTCKKIARKFTKIWSQKGYEWPLFSLNNSKNNILWSIQTVKNVKILHIIFYSNHIQKNLQKNLILQSHKTF